MKLTRLVVAEELERLGFPFDSGPEGFQLALPSNWLLRSGSGIAGRGATWFLWNLKTGEKRGVGGVGGPSAETIGDLRKLMHFDCDRCGKQLRRGEFTSCRNTSNCVRRMHARGKT